MTTDTGDKHLSLRQQVRTLDNLVDAQAKTIRDLEAAVEAEKRITERNAETARDFMAKAERAEQDLGYKSKRIEDLYAENQRLAAETQRLTEQRDGLQRGLDAMRTDRDVAWDAHAREKAARESWVQAYRETLTRAEKAEQALGEVVTALFGGNAEGMAACVTAGPQCHYELPYEACKRLLAVLRSDALRHVHTYAPDTRVCSCGHAEADDSR